MVLQLQSTTEPLSLLTLLQLNPGPLSGKQIRDHHDPGVPTGQSTTFTVKVDCLEIDDQTGTGNLRVLIVSVAVRHCNGVTPGSASAEDPRETTKLH